MNDDAIVWSQNATNRSRKIKNFLVFLYEFVGIRFSIIAFLTLLSVATIELPFFENALTISISLLMYYLLKDAFSIFWVGINFKYCISELGIDMIGAFLGAIIYLLNLRRFLKYTQ